MIKPHRSPLSFWLSHSESEEAEEMMQKAEEPGEAAEHPVWGDGPDKIDGPCITAERLEVVKWERWQ